VLAGWLFAVQFPTVEVRVSNGVGFRLNVIPAAASEDLIAAISSSVVVVPEE
jgi:hypothetical protein